MARSQGWTQLARLVATLAQSVVCILALVGMPAGTFASLLVGKEAVAAASLPCRSAPIISLMMAKASSSCCAPLTAAIPEGIEKIPSLGTWVSAGAPAAL